MSPRHPVIVSPCQERRAFTLVELLVVIAIIAVLVGLLIPAVQAVREAGYRARCQNNLKQLALAVHAYHATHEQMPAYQSQGQPQGGWFVHLLPYLEENSLYGRIVSGQIWQDGVHDYRFRTLECPSDPSRGGGLLYDSWGGSSYLANFHALGDSAADGSTTEGPWSRLGYRSPAASFSSLTDGPSNTILFAEGYAWCDDVGRIALYAWHHHNFGLTGRLQQGQLDPAGNFPPVDYPNGMPNTWMFQVRPRALPSWACPEGADCCNKWAAQTPHRSMHVALADGSVRSLDKSISQQTWGRLLLPRDGGVLGSDW